MFQMVFFLVCLCSLQFEMECNLLVWVLFSRACFRFLIIYINYQMKIKTDYIMALLWWCNLGEELPLSSSFSSIHQTINWFVTLGTYFKITSTFFLFVVFLRGMFSLLLFCHGWNGIYLSKIPSFYRSILSNCKHRKVMNKLRNTMTRENKNKTKMKNEFTLE